MTDTGILARIKLSRFQLRLDAWQLCSTNDALFAIIFRSLHVFPTLQRVTLNVVVGQRLTPFALNSTSVSLIQDALLELEFLERVEFILSDVPSNLDIDRTDFARTIFPKLHEKGLVG